MAQGISNIASFASVSLTGEVVINQYVADGYTGDEGTVTLTFSGGAPPTDGSVGLAFIVIDDTLPFSYTQGNYQRLAYWADHTVGGAAVTGGGVYQVQVPSWAFLADDGVDD